MRFRPAVNLLRNLNDCLHFATRWPTGLKLSRPNRTAAELSIRAWLRCADLDLFPSREVRAIRMVEHHRADAGFRLHHHAFGQLDTDLFRPQQRPQSGLIVQVGTCRVSEAIALTP